MLLFKLLISIKYKEVEDWGKAGNCGEEKTFTEVIPYFISGCFLPTDFQQ